MKVGTRIKAAAAGILMAACLAAAPSPVQAGTRVMTPAAASFTVLADSVRAKGFHMPRHEWAVRGRQAMERAEAAGLAEPAGAKKAEAIVQTARELSGMKRLLFVQKAWNAIPYMTDSQAWGMPDYMASPGELAARNGGDCEDYAFAKAWTLKQSGWDADKVFVLVFREGTGNGGKKLESHAVCCAVDGGRIVVLDNRRTGLASMDETMADCGSPAAAFSMEGRMWRMMRGKQKADAMPAKLKPAADSTSWTSCLVQAARKVAGRQAGRTAAPQGGMPRQ